MLIFFSAACIFPFISHTKVTAVVTILCFYVLLILDSALPIYMTKETIWRFSQSPVLLSTVWGKDANFI
jgi:hypothetical protein